VTLSDDAFGAPPRAALLHQALRREQANARQGTHDSKTRGEVSYTTAKWYRQKGTGRARQGARFKPPHHIHGGVAHGPHPRSYRQHLPQRMRRLALQSAIAAKVGAGELSLVDGLTLQAPRTKTMAQLIDRIAPGSSTLLVLEGPQPAVLLSVRNLPHVTLATTDNVSVLDVLRHQRVVLSLAAARQLEARFGAAEVSGPGGAPTESITVPEPAEPNQDPPEPMPSSRGPAPAGDRQSKSQNDENHSPAPGEEVTGGER
jgi:large subunit ribosomal protein L4